MDFDSGRLDAVHDYSYLGAADLGRVERVDDEKRGLRLLLVAMVRKALRGPAESLGLVKQDVHGAGVGAGLRSRPRCPRQRHRSRRPQGARKPPAVTRVRRLRVKLWKLPAQDSPQVPCTLRPRGSLARIRRMAL